jgi:DNA end-binding protein Ku
MERALHGRIAMARRTSHAKKAEVIEDVDDAGTGRARGGPGRSIWGGSISFGLLQIPISLYTAESRAEELHFRMLDKKDLSPIRFKRVNESTGREVEWKNIVKGYEIEPDSFVVLEKGDLEKANVKATQTIDIQDFVPAEDIDRAFFETPYYLIPQKRAAKAYVLLRKALEKRKAAAIATFVLRTKEHLCALIPNGDAIMLEILRFGHELKEASAMPLPAKGDEGDLSARELRMAEQLIDGMMTEWDPAKYRDRYYRDVLKMIDEKAKTGSVTARHAEATGTVANDVVDLLDLLKRSVSGGAANTQTKSKPGIKKAKARAKKKTTKKKRKAA